MAPRDDEAGGRDVSDGTHGTPRAADPQEARTLVPLFAWLTDAPGSLPAHWDEDAAASRLAAAADAPGSSRVLVAGPPGAVVGFCTVYLDLLSVRYGPRAWVEDLAVAPQQRSGGVGGRLLHAAGAWARDQGASHLELDSGVARTDAHRFYERHAPAWRSLCYGWDLTAEATLGR